MDVPTGGAGGAAASCRSPQAGPAPLARLTNVEYSNTLRDLLPGVDLTSVTMALPTEIPTDGYVGNAHAQAPSADYVERFEEIAHQVAELAVADPSKIMGCTPSSPAVELNCGAKFIAAFGRRAYRRPLTSDEDSRHRALFEAAYSKYGLTVALRMTVEAYLQSPNFLYRIEAVAPDEPTDKPVALGNYELASRLSYLLTDTMPDENLLAAAEAGALSSPQGLEQQARRLLTTGAARSAVATFTSQWLRFDRMADLTKAPDLFPQFTSTMAASMRTSVSRYVDHLVWEGAHTLPALLTDDGAFVDAQLAPLYEVAVPGGMEQKLMETDPRRRSGILTQVGLLAGLAHERNDAPVLRGLFVLDRFLCSQPPAPPPDVRMSLPDLTPASQLTTRQQLERSHSEPTCAACHKLIDGVGFGFENYDALGRWRTEEFGLPVDPTGTLVGAADIDGPYSGAIELGRKLASSTTVSRCVTSHWLSYALASRRADLDDCAVDQVTRSFVGKDLDFRELLITAVVSDAFRYRPAGPR
jgi:hypothetical protein